MRLAGVMGGWMSASWPAADTDVAFDTVRRDERALRPGVDAVRTRLGVADLPCARFSEGSLPVYALGDALVLKLYPPVYAFERDREQLVLEVVAGQLPVPTPRVHAAGDHDGWGFVLMDHLVGESLAAAWPQLDDPQAIASQLGRALAALHAIRDPRLEALDDARRGAWDAFLVDQRTTVVERQHARGLDPAWLEQIPAFLDETPLTPCPSGPALLHTEVMREHLLVAPAPGGGWLLTGLFDFEPARLGHPEYELSSVGLFVACGDRRLLRRVLEAYGTPPAELGPELSRRILAYALLHQYSNLPWYMRRVPPRITPADGLGALAEAWFGLSRTPRG